MTLKTATSAILAILATASLYSCSNDEPKPAADINTLNMLNESNGKTIIGQSDVYISDANNFVSSACQISSLGKRSGISSSEAINLSNTAQTVAVIPGEGYQIFPNTIVRAFPSGNIAARINTGYYDVYVPSAISKDGEVIGATVQYTLSMVPQGSLPTYDNPMGKMKYVGDTVVMYYPNGTEYELDAKYDSDAFKITTSKEQLKVTLTKQMDKDNGPYGDYYIYVCYYDKWSRVKFQVME